MSQRKRLKCSKLTMKMALFSAHTASNGMLTFSPKINTAGLIRVWTCDHFCHSQSSPATNNLGSKENSFGRVVRVSDNTKSVFRIREPYVIWTLRETNRWSLDFEIWVSNYKSKRTSRQRNKKLWILCILILSCIITQRNHIKLVEPSPFQTLNSYIQLIST